MEEFLEEDLVVWKRITGKNKKEDIMMGEFVKLVKHKKNYTGKQKALVILNDRYYPIQIPVSELSKSKGIK